MQGFTRVEDTAGDTRLIIEAPSKAARRLLLAAMKKSRGIIRCVPALTPEEKNKKHHVYKEAKHYGMEIHDAADIMDV